MADNLSEFEKRWNAMRSEAFNGWMSSWKMLSTYINQKRGWFDSEANRGDMIDHKTLLDSHATQANRILASGLLSGMTSPSRPWFRLTLDNLTLDSVPGVRLWLDEVQRRMVEVLNKSNIYSTFYSAYEELGQFGTSCFLILEDFENIIRCRSFTVGEYYLGTDSRGRVNSFARYFWMNAGQIVKEFGEENTPLEILGQYRNNQPDTWFKISHLIEPNETRIPDKTDYQNMPWRSAYWKYGSTGDKALAKRGYLRFPVVAARWNTSTTDQIYGYGPGWDALGNIKQLQKTTLDKLLAQEKLHNPPMMKDASVEGHVNLLPGGVTTITGAVPNSGLRTSYQIDPKLDSFIEMINHLYDAIDKDFYVNLFLTLINIDKNQMTATEVAERQQEKIMMMGPVLYKIQEELLDPTMELIFSIMSESGLIPPPPKEIQGMNLKVKYVSILAQAQQALGVEQINRVVGFVGQAAAVNPDIIDVINWDEAAREVGNLEGTPAKIFNDKETVDAIRQQKQKMQQAAMAAQVANSAADTTQKLANAPMDKPDQSSALDKLMAGSKR